MGRGTNNDGFSLPGSGEVNLGGGEEEGWLCRLVHDKIYIENQWPKDFLPACYFYNGRVVQCLEFKK
jgi:hypothetical protein